MQVLIKIANLIILTVLKSPATKMSKKAVLLNYRRLLPNNPYQLQLMLKLGNSTQVVSSLTAVNHWTTVSWLLVMIQAATGLLKTHGELLGEWMDTSPLNLETLAD